MSEVESAATKPDSPLSFLFVHACSLVEPPDESQNPASPGQIEELERAIRDLKIRVQRLERLLAPRTENPTDQAVVQSKVVYDWQK